MRTILNNYDPHNSETIISDERINYTIMPKLIGFNAFLTIAIFTSSFVLFNLGFRAAMKDNFDPSKEREDQIEMVNIIEIILLVLTILTIVGTCYAFSLTSINIAKNLKNLKYESKCFRNMQ